jgi:Response regulator containing CheY-like receiver, AAA-type ATPase, and DNA-binding domains
LLDEIKVMHPNMPVVMISGHGNVETAVSAIRAAPMISSKSRSRRTG